VKATAATALVYDEIHKKHLTGPGHPESPARCDAIVDALDVAAFAARLVRLSARPARDQEVLACHSRRYVATAKADIAAGRPNLSTGDTAICRDSLTAALHAAGGALAAVDAVFDGHAENAFCAVRPPGHHANRSAGMGFCIFNNVALAARYAQLEHGISKVLIADWDVHHGNGTQDIFYEDGSVFYFSTHQWPLYPGTGSAGETGTGKGLGTTLNCPVPAGAGKKEILAAFREQLGPAANSFKPELVLISAGFDSRAGDPLGDLTLADEDFAELTAICLAIAAEHAEGRVVSLLEGGYDLAGVASAAVAHCGALDGEAQRCRRKASTGVNSSADEADKSTGRRNHRPKRLEK